LAKVDATTDESDVWKCFSELAPFLLLNLPLLLNQLVINTSHGYTATIWAATSADGYGYGWTEQGQALRRGPVGGFDEHAVFTPSVLVYGGRYYPELHGGAGAVLQRCRQPTLHHRHCHRSSGPNSCFRARARK